MGDGGTEERLSVLVGDRLCTRCGYNLAGQPVLREPHYKLLIVRCPECADVASLQEYPLLGRWVGRWAAIIAAVWILVVIGMFIGSAGERTLLRADDGAPPPSPLQQGALAFGVAVLGCLAAYISVMTRRALKEIRAAKAEWPQAA